MPPSESGGKREQDQHFRPSIAWRFVAGWGMANDVKPKKNPAAVALHRAGAD
jgi:hypothetical protein